MIDQVARDQLRALIKGDVDYKAAAVIYQKATGRKIHWRYFYKFITGQRKIEGKKPGSHQPLKMWEAIVDAVVQRKMEAEMMTIEAKEILSQRLAA